MSKEFSQSIIPQASTTKFADFEPNRSQVSILQFSERILNSIESNGSDEEANNHLLLEPNLPSGEEGIKQNQILGTKERISKDIDREQATAFEEHCVSFVVSMTSRKSRRVQVPSSDITKGISSIEPSSKKGKKKRFHDPTPLKMGVLVGVPCQRRSWKPDSDKLEQLELLKHFALVFLFSRLKNPSKWDATTFPEILALGNLIESTQITSNLCVHYNNLDYRMTLTSTVAKGRISCAETRPPALKDALIEHVSRYNGLVLKCESHYVLLWRTAEGFYVYDPCLKNVSQMMFINSMQLLVEFLLESKQLKPRSKFYISKIIWYAVDDGMIITLKRNYRKAKQFKILNIKEALLLGDRYIKKAGFKLESFQVSMNAIKQAQQLEVSSWDAAILNQLFDRSLMNDKKINKLRVFLLEEGEQEVFLLEEMRLIRHNGSFAYTKREAFEEHINRFLAVRFALIIRINESFFSIWNSRNILYWFSPFRFDALNTDPSDLENKACFVYAFNTLDRLSATLFEYLTETGLFPEFNMHIFSLDGEPFGNASRLALVDSTDSLNCSQLEIRVPEYIKRKEYTQIDNLPPMTLSEAKLCRIMVKDIMNNANSKYL